jgi:hypothetical protein
MHAAAAHHPHHAATMHHLAPHRPELLLLFRS